MWNLPVLRKEFHVLCTLFWLIIQSCVKIDDQVAWNSKASVFKFKFYNNLDSFHSAEGSHFYSYFEKVKVVVVI